MPCPLPACLSKKVDQNGVCINTTCLLRQNSLQPVGITECLVCLASTECFMQPICKHYLCTTCIRRVYYVCNIEDMIPADRPTDPDQLKEYNYRMANQAAQLAELRSCPVCRR